MCVCECDVCTVHGAAGLCGAVLNCNHSNGRLRWISLLQWCDVNGSRGRGCTASIGEFGMYRCLHAVIDLRLLCARRGGRGSSVKGGILMEKFGPALQNQSVFQHVMDLCLQSHVGMMLIISGRRWKENASVNRSVSRRAARRRIQMNKSHTWGGGGGSGVLKLHILHFIKSPSERWRD